MNTNIFQLMQAHEYLSWGNSRIFTGKRWTVGLIQEGRRREVSNNQVIQKLSKPHSVLRVQIIKTPMTCFPIHRQLGYAF